MVITVQDASMSKAQFDSMSALAGSHSTAQECNQTSCTTDHCPIFRTIGNAKSFEKGDVIFRQGEPNDQVYLLVSGIVRGSKVLADGRRLIARFALAGQLLEYDLQPQCPFTAEAITPVCAIVIQKSRLERATSEIPCLQNLLMRALLSELQESRSQVLALGRLTGIERVAQFLYSLSQTLGRDADGAVQIPMSRSDIADYLGLTIETVSRLVSRLKREGRITLLENNRFIICDEDQFVAEFLDDAF
ncbi:MAG: Crp/Fnr family transcriptional regulator [Hyphomicrobiaceae bacterium]